MSVKNIYERFVWFDDKVRGESIPMPTRLQKSLSFPPRLLKEISNLCGIGSFAHFILRLKSRPPVQILLDEELPEDKIPY